MNEQYEMPAMPEGAQEGILKGMYRFSKARTRKAKVEGAAARQRHDPQRSARGGELLEKYGVAADVWSVTSYNELYRDAHACDRWNMLNPTEKPKVPVRHAVPEGHAGRDRRRLRLPEGAAGVDRPLDAAARACARHRRLRPQRGAQGAAGVLRGGVRRYIALGHARGARAERRDRAARSSRRPSRTSGSTRTRRIPAKD